VLSLEEFEEKGTTSPEFVYTRAEFDTRKKSFKPDFNKWTKMCSCQRPTNPLQQYICCDGCEKWYHPECQKTSSDIDNFICSECSSDK